MFVLTLYNNRAAAPMGFYAMDIDLLFTAAGEAGLIADENMVNKAIGALFDPATGLMTLEFADMDYMELNIPVDTVFFETLDRCAQIHLGAIKNGHIAQAYQIPLMFADDPYRGEALKGLQGQTANPLQAFDRFVKRCTGGQPVHRSDLGDESRMGCVLGDASPAALQFAPHLARRHALEASPKLSPAGGPRFSGPGLGSGGGSYTVPPSKSERDDKAD